MAKTITTLGELSKKVDELKSMSIHQAYQELTPYVEEADAFIQSKAFGMLYAQWLKNKEQSCKKI